MDKIPVDDEQPIEKDTQVVKDNESTYKAFAKLLKGIPVDSTIDYTINHSKDFHV